ncbi:MAG: hypothetical protein Kow00121_11940 [Elainellaceae cyanobacterium]
MNQYARQVLQDKRPIRYFAQDESYRCDRLGEWRWQQRGEFEPFPENPMFLVQDPKNKGQRLGYKGLVNPSGEAA